MIPSIQDRLLNGLVKDLSRGCWLWTRCVGRSGYGHMGVDGRTEGTHRVSWALFCGPIPDGLWVLHECDVPLCCNPTHLFLGTVADNNRDASRKGRSAAGERNGAAKLSAADVEAIRAAYRPGMGYKVLAAQYGVSLTQVAHIVTNKHWRVMTAGGASVVTRPPRARLDVRPLKTKAGA